MTTVLSQKGQIVLSSAVREQMHLESGQDSEVLIDDEDTILPRRVARPPNRGLIDLLQSCPYPFELPQRAKDLPRSIEL
jgi:bifunctional DNA-binding transcriptional regulator/antitoxin component of YhaV-PrlF toxin-antitoxin module